ncbi:oxaloacetate decarboxylase alpha chain [Salmonella enterica subsp. enterica]|uniref:Oxaloacetate decarboxylase alpha chain n=1 Tax=Salmonella enterica I TaxID=59201 RepID=A0A379WX65_SALET|nr:oxaloacetate decarboxylase alpha chain [Salmonella enterica subsp. enterica]
MVKVSDGGDYQQLTAADLLPLLLLHRPGRRRHPVTAPLAGNIWKVIATEARRWPKATCC